MPPLHSEHYRCKEGIHWTKLGTETVVLDLDSGRYFMLLGSGADVWDLAVEGLPQSSIEERHASKHMLSMQKAESDIRNFIKGLVTSGLLVPSTDKKKGQGHTMPGLLKRLHGVRLRKPAAVPKSGQIGIFSRTQSLLAATAMLFLVDIGIYLFGLHRVSKWISSAYPSSICQDVERGVVRDIAQIPLSAYRWYRPGAVCTQRAVTTYWYLLSRSVRVDLCIGVATQPFASHCWVEYKGKPINEIQDEVKQFAIIARIA